MISVICIIYLCYIIVSLLLFTPFISFFVERYVDYDIIKIIFLGFIYYIPKTIIIKIKEKKALNNKEIKRKFENEVNEIKHKLEALDIVMFRIFYDILIGVNCEEYSIYNKKKKD